MDFRELDAGERHEAVESGSEQSGGGGQVDRIECQDFPQDDGVVRVEFEVTTRRALPRDGPRRFSQGILQKNSRRRVSSGQPCNHRQQHHAGNGDDAFSLAGASEKNSQDQAANQRDEGSARNVFS